MGKKVPSDSSSSSSESGASNSSLLRGIFTSVIDHIFKALPASVDTFVKQKFRDNKRKREERMERGISSDPRPRSLNPYRRRERVAVDDHAAYRVRWEDEENLANQGPGVDELVNDRMHYRYGGVTRRTVAQQPELDRGERRRHLLLHHRRHQSRRRILSRRSSRLSPRGKSYTTLNVALPFSDEVMHAGAVGIVAGAATAFRLRSTSAEWLGEKGVRAGSSTAAAAVASLVVRPGDEEEISVLREVVLPAIVGVGVDRILWE